MPGLKLKIQELADGWNAKESGKDPMSWNGGNGMEPEATRSITSFGKRPGANY